MLIYKEQYLDKSLFSDVDRTFLIPSLLNRLPIPTYASDSYSPDHAIKPATIMSVEIPAIVADAPLAVTVIGGAVVVGVPFVKAAHEEKFCPPRNTPTVCASVRCNV